MTLGLTVGAAVLWLLFGSRAGCCRPCGADPSSTGCRPRSRWSGVSVPEFFTGMLLIYLLTSGPPALRWYPDGINYVPFTEDPVGWFVNMIPPWICLALLFAALYTRLTRAKMLETMSEDYIRTARAKGLPPRAVIGRHGLRAALPPLVTIVGHGHRRPARRGGPHRDAVQLPRHGTAGLHGDHHPGPAGDHGRHHRAALLIVLANIVVDVLHAFLDPRVRHGR